MIGTRSSSEALAERQATPTRVGHVRWTICAMLFAATSINYMDRQVIAILKPTLEHSIGMSEIGYGYVVDAFQIAYALGLLMAGRFVDRVGTRKGYMAIMATWSVSAMGHALASSVLGFGMARFLLGLGESGNFPAALKTISEWFPQRERSLATGLFNSGANVGAILAPVIVPWVTIRFGWHAAFLVTGIFSSLWIALWYLKYQRPSDHLTVSAEEMAYIEQDALKTGVGKASWLTLLSLRQTWAFAIGKFLTDPIWWFYLFWLPSYFSTKFHLDLSHLGLPLIVVYNVAAVGSIGGGGLPIVFHRLGMTHVHARLTAMFACACLVVPVVALPFIHSEGAAIALLSLAAAAHCGWSANILTTPSDMFPRHAVGSVAGIGGMAGSVGGTLFAASAGHILQFTHSYNTLFYSAAAAYLVAFALILLIAPGLKKAEGV